MLIIPKVGTMSAMKSPGKTLGSTETFAKQGGRTRHFYGRPVPTETM